MLEAKAREAALIFYAWHKASLYETPGAWVFLRAAPYVQFLERKGGMMTR